MLKDFDCIDGNMNILMYDNTIKKVKDLKDGEKIYSVQYDGYKYILAKSEVLSVSKRKAEAIKITLSDGRSIISTKNHQWLTKLGWHFSCNDETLEGSKYYLKEDMKMFGMSNQVKKNYTETPLYMAGYIVGAEIYGKNLVDFKGGENADFVLREGKVTTRIYNYMLYFGISAEIKDCFAHTKDTNEYYITKKLSVSYKEMIKFSQKQMKNKDNEEFIRGFVAGVYDSDGTEHPFIKKVNSPKKAFLDIMQKGLDMYGFEYEFNSQEMTTELKGGPLELVRFYSVYTPINVCKFENIEIENKYSENVKIVSIETVKCNDLVEIITTGRNFIVNGIVTHNCTTGLIKEV